MFGHGYGYKRLITFRDKLEWVRLQEITEFSVQGLPSAKRARRSRDHLVTDSVRSELPPLSVPVSLSLVSREASRDFVTLD